MKLGRITLLETTCHVALPKYCVDLIEGRASGAGLTLAPFCITSINNCVIRFKILRAILCSDFQSGVTRCGFTLPARH